MTGPDPRAPSRTTPLLTHLVRSTAMHVVLTEQSARLLVQERQQQAAQHNRAARLVSARRWDKRAEVAAHRARLARLAVQ